MKLFTRVALAVMLATAAAPAGYLISSPDSLMSNSADYLVITHDSFTAAMYPLCALRDSLGLNVKMAQLSLIYSTFNSGPRTDRIKAFLQQVYDHWNTRPEFLLLVGDACMDSTQGDMLPVKRFSKFSYPYASGLTTHGADNWYVTLAGRDSIPDMIVGRLPVQTAVRAESLVAKIVGYETAPDTGAWIRTVMLLASNDMVSMADYVDSAFLAPAGDSVYTVLESQGTSAFLRQKTRAGFNAGASLLCQFTHGTQPPAWVGSKTLFSYQDVDSLTNLDALPVTLGRG